MIPFPLFINVKDNIMHLCNVKIKFISNKTLDSRLNMTSILKCSKRWDIWKLTFLGDKHKRKYFIAVLLGFCGLNNEKIVSIEHYFDSTVLAFNILGKSDNDIGLPGWGRSCTCAGAECPRRREQAIRVRFHIQRALRHWWHGQICIQR